MHEGIRFPRKGMRVKKFRVEAKRKGVARVEAFLDMMSFKANGDASNDVTSMVTKASKMIQNDEAKYATSTATSSSQSPSPPTFSSPSPEESINRLDFGFELFTTHSQYHDTVRLEWFIKKIICSEITQLF